MCTCIRVSSREKKKNKFLFKNCWTHHKFKFFTASLVSLLSLTQLPLEWELNQPIIELDHGPSPRYPGNQSLQPQHSLHHDKESTRLLRRGIRPPLQISI